MARLAAIAGPLGLLLAGALTAVVVHGGPDPGPVYTLAQV